MQFPSKDIFLTLPCWQMCPNAPNLWTTKDHYNQGEERLLESLISKIELQVLEPPPSFSLIVQYSF